jgi:hypothetical protein
LYNKIKPQVLGLKRSFGFGDRLGLATPGHLEALKGKPFLPILAQQSIRELGRTDRQPEDVMESAVQAIEEEGYTGVWGADGDHLQTKEDVFRVAEAGYTFFTIDPSEYVNDAADKMLEAELQISYQRMVKNGELSDSDLFDIYINRIEDVESDFILSFSSQVLLLRAIVKYGAALNFAQKMYHWIGEACPHREYEVEISVDETETPTTPLEHLFIGLNLKRLGIRVVSLAPRFVGEFEKGIDFKGDIVEFEKQYTQHVAIAKYCGPYKLSIHSGSDKFSVYPIMGRLSGELLHVKTAGTSYLEALRVICRTDVPLFREIISFARGRFDIDKKTYHVSAQLSMVPESIRDKDLEEVYLNQVPGRQILHVTFGSTLKGGTDSQGESFKPQIMGNLESHKELYKEVLAIHLGKHLSLLLSELS